MRSITHTNITDPGCDVKSNNDLLCADPAGRSSRRVHNAGISMLAPICVETNTSQFDRDPANPTISWNISPTN